MSNVVLVGLPSAGKSSVGRELAAATGRDFVDLDALVEERTGRSPADWITSRGEEAFREVEARLAVECAGRDNQVIATGGGTVIDPLARYALWNSGPVVWLDADDDQLADRVAHGPERPLGANLEAISARRAERERFYAAADVHVRDAGDPATTARTIAARLPVDGTVPPARTYLRHGVRRDHPMGPREALISFGRSLGADDITHLTSALSTGTPVVVMDQRVAEAQPGLRAAFPTERLLLIDASEANKRLSSAEAMLDFASERRAERSDAWIAVGGGTTGDLVGTAAALYMRGAPLVQVPTTWLAMGDASIGGKVAVDLAGAKNTAGAFWPPVAVVGDIATLRSLSEHLLRDGMAETLKSGIIGDPWLWDLIRERGRAAITAGEGADLAARYALVERTALLKVGVVDRDPFELGERRSLNLGHTIGHALEIESGYSLSHGQAVALGIRAVAHIARARRILAPDVAEEIDETIGMLGFAMDRVFDPDAALRALTGDKKSVGGRIRWILPTAIGQVVEASDVTADEVAAALAHIHTHRQASSPSHRSQP